MDRTGRRCLFRGARAVLGPGTNGRRSEFRDGDGHSSCVASAAGNRVTLQTQCCEASATTVVPKVHVRCGEKVAVS